MERINLERYDTRECAWIFMLSFSEEHADIVRDRADAVLLLAQHTALTARLVRPGQMVADWYWTPLQGWYAVGEVTA